jgi:hypothetical protein
MTTPTPDIGRPVKESSPSDTSYSHIDTAWELIGLTNRVGGRMQYGSVNFPIWKPGIGATTRMFVCDETKKWPDGITLALAMPITPTVAQPYETSIGTDSLPFAV